MKRKKKSELPTRMVAKDYEDKIEDMANTILSYGENTKEAIKVLLVENTKWYGLSIIWCGIAVISIVINIIQIFI